MTFNISSLPTLQNFLPLAAAKQPVEDNPSLVRDEQQVGITRTSADVSAEQAWLAFRRYLTPLQDKLSRGDADWLVNAEGANEELEYHLLRLTMQERNTAGDTPPPGEVISGNDLIDKHLETIGEMETEYLQVFLHAFDQMSAFYKAFVELKATLSSHLLPSDKEGQILFQAHNFAQKVQELINKFSGTNGQLFPQPDADGKYGTTTEDIAKKWIANLGLPADCLKGDEKSGFWVQIDLKPLDNIVQTLLNLNGSRNYGAIILNAAIYNAWESGFNSHAEGFQTLANLLTQKMTNANSAFDQRVLILSKFTEQEAQSRMMVIQNLK